MRNWLKLFVLFFLSTGVHAGTITLSTASLFSFGNCAIYHASDAQFYTVTATGLSQNLSIVAPLHFEVSLTYGTGYSNRLVITPIAGNIATTVVYVRFSPFLSGAQSGSISHSSAASTTQNKSVSGTGTTGTGAGTYYNTISTTASGATLKTALYNKILGHSVTSYSGLWATYSSTDALWNGKVWDIYSTKLNSASPYEYTFSTDQCGTYSIEGDCYNREHSFPQSWFTSSSPMVSDMYHIYPTDGKVNGMRNNYPHGEVTSATFTSLQGGKLGPNVTSGYTAVTFEPIDDYKGDLARSFFYMATRYENLVAGWQSNGNANDVLAGNSFPAYDTWFLNVLVKWHNQDPPGAKEINRNNAINSYQGNRNPFIDSPQYVNRIWGGAAAVEPVTSPSLFQLISNTTSSVTIGWKNGSGQRRLVIARASAPVNALPADYNTYAANSTFGSGAQLGSGNYVVYNGMGSVITVNGLNQNLSYHFLVVEYNGYGAATNYLTTTTLASGAVSLPVSWLSLEAQQLNAAEIQLHWATAAEINNQEFTVERLNEDGAFEDIGSLQGAGNSIEVKHYYFSDKNFYTQNRQTDVVVYRIKQTDTDGKFTYSDELAVMLENKLPEFYPANPVHDAIHYTSGFGAQPVQYTISNLYGNELYRQKTILGPEGYLSLDANLPAGMYMLNILYGTRQQSFRIIKY